MLLYHFHVYLLSNQGLNKNFKQDRYMIEISKLKKQGKTMTQISSKREIKAFTIIAYPADCQVIDLQKRLPIMLEYLHINNTSYSKKDLEKNLGDFTKDMFEVVLQEDGSALITNNNGKLMDYICLFLNKNLIDFKFTKLDYEDIVQFNDKEDVRYVLQFDEKQLSSRITESVFLEALQSHTKSDISNWVFKYLIESIDESIENLRIIDCEVMREEGDQYFEPRQVLSQSWKDLLNKVSAK